MRIHAIDIFQPPAMGMSSIAIELPQTTVPAALARNKNSHSAAQAPGRPHPGMVYAPRSAGSRQQSRAPTAKFVVAIVTPLSGPAVLVVTAPPDAPLVAPQRGAIQPLVHAPQAVQTTRVRRVGVVHGAAVAHEGAHPGPLADARGHVGPDHGGELRHRPLAAVQQPRPLARVVVFRASGSLLRFADADAKVVVEVGSHGRRPRESPPHALLVSLQLGQRRA